MIVKGNIIDIVRTNEGYIVYVRYAYGGKVYLSPALNRFAKSVYFPNEEVILELSEDGATII